jgi:hypothetical protein
MSAQCMTYLLALPTFLFLMLETCQHLLLLLRHSHILYRAQTFGATPVASLINIGVSGLCFFIVGYVRLRNDLRGVRSALRWK